MLGWLFAPLAWLLGIPWEECAKAGTLLGVKTVLNELIAYLQLGQIAGRRAVGALAPDPHLRAVRLCQLRQPRHHDRRHGGDGARRAAPRSSSLGAKTLISGTLATLMTAAVVGALTPPP